MIEISNAINNTEITDLLGFIIAALLTGGFTYYFIGEAFSIRSLDSKKTKKQKRWFIALATVALCLTLSLVIFIMNQKERNSELLQERLALGNEILEYNVELLLAEVEPRFKKGEMTVNELRFYIESQPDYFSMKYTSYAKFHQKRELNNFIKKEVYKKTERDNPLYQQLIIESQELFEQ